MSSTATARSPSPGPAAARPCFGLRRSADSSPITASTPDPPPQRSASVGRTGRASPRASLAEKENDGHRHHQHSRDAARTPGRAARHSIGGGGKSFMAPTISAASKAVAASPAASPRKRILGERNNDPVPSSPGAPPAARAGPPPVQTTEEPLGAPRAPEPLMSPCPGDLLAHPKPRGPPPSEEPLGAPRRLRLSLDGAPPAPPPPAAAVAVADAPVPSLGGEVVEVVKAPVCEVRRRHDGAGDAPYDPKTNYLSPRPQYLRYKPNPRVELYRQNSSARRLDDGLASSDSSDATTTTTEEEEEEGTSEEEQESQSALVPASDASADPVAAPVAPAVLPPEPAPASPPPRAPTPDPEEPAPTSPRARAPTPDPKEPAPTPESPTPELEAAASPARAPAEKKRKRSFLLVAPLAALVLFVAFVCVPPPPDPGSPVVLSASLSKVSDYFLSVQELHPVELAAWLEQWSSGSLDFVTSYWNALASSSREQEFFGPPTAANLSAAAANDADHGAGFYYSAAESRPMPIEQEPVGASIFEEELGIQEVVPAIDTAAVTVEEVAAPNDATEEDESTDDAGMVQESFPATSNVIEELNEFGDDGLVAEQVSDNSGEASFSQDIDIPAQSEVLDAEITEEVSDNSGEEMASFSQDMVDIPSQSEPEPEHIKDDMDVPSLQQDVQTDGAEGDQEEANEKDQEAHHGQKSGSDMWSSYLDKISKPAIAGSVLVVLIVSAALAFLHMRQNRARVSLSTDEPTEQEPAEQVEQLEEHRSGSGSSEGHTLAKGSQSQLKDPVVEETDRIGGSGTSQFSSSLSSGLGRRKKNKEEQSLQSFEPTSRRESTTSSYGSFTTYEKIPAKKKKQGG